MSNVSKLLRSLTKNERMSKLPVFLSESFNRSFAHFSQKKSDSHRKPMSEFPALLYNFDCAALTGAR